MEMREELADRRAAIRRREFHRIVWNKTKQVGGDDVVAIPGVEERVEHVGHTSNFLCFLSLLWLWVT